MLSLVVPTFNMAEHLGPLWQGVVNCGLAALVDEAVFVDDASTDGTAAVLAGLGAEPHHQKIRVVSHAHNQGRFAARRTGAQHARSERLLFLDSRVELPHGFGAALEQLLPLYAHVVGVVELDVKRSVFSLYWERAHQALYRQHHAALRRGPVELSPGNFERHLKGTTVFLTQQDFFLRHCTAVHSAGTKVLNDDTVLMRSMVSEHALTIHPALRVCWTPRQDVITFLKHLYARGPSFTEYHVFLHRGGMFAAVMAGLIALFTAAACAVLMPSTLPLLLGAALTLLLLSALWVTQDPWELVKILPLHAATVVAFGVGVLRGLWMNLARMREGSLPIAAWH